MSNEERQAALMLWLEENGVTLQAIAEAMGVSRAFVSVMLRRETVPAKRRRQLIVLGLPEELLPPAFEGSMGRPRAPRFLPGLVARAQEQ